MVFLALSFIIFCAIVGAIIGGLIRAALRDLFRPPTPLPQQYILRFRAQAGPNTVCHIPPHARLESQTTCPFCKRPAQALATRERLRIECRDCGVVEGTADTPGVGCYSISIR